MMLIWICFISSAIILFISQILFYHLAKNVVDLDLFYLLGLGLCIQSYLIFCQKLLLTWIMLMFHFCQKMLLTWICFIFWQKVSRSASILLTPCPSSSRPSNSSATPSAITFSVAIQSFSQMYVLILSAVCCFKPNR